MTKYDAFTIRRLLKFTEDFREKKGQLPIGKDYEGAGFTAALVDYAVREGKLVALYVTLTSGAIVKGFKVKE